jgi:hypothetical protein
MHFILTYHGWLIAVAVGLSGRNGIDIWLSLILLKSVVIVYHGDIQSNE